jgi:hypothetical protein
MRTITNEQENPRPCIPTNTISKDQLSHINLNLQAIFHNMPTQPHPNPNKTNHTDRFSASSFAFAAFSRLPNSASIPIPPKTQATPTHCIAPKL